MEASTKPALIIAPHQDDETFGCGGLIALKIQRNVPVKVVFLTDGAGSHRHLHDIDAEELSTLRQQEAEAAGRVLGLEPNDLSFLAYPDSGLRMMDGAQHEEAVDHLCGVLRDFRPGEVYVTHRRDKHRDHEAAYEIAAQAVERSGLNIEIYQYLVWGIWWSALGLRLAWSDFSGARRLFIGPVRDRKQQAIAVYHSQIDVLPRGFLNRFLGTHEMFFTLSDGKRP